MHSYSSLTLLLHFVHCALGGLPLDLAVNVRLSDFPASSLGKALSVESFCFEAYPPYSLYFSPPKVFEDA